MEQNSLQQLIYVLASIETLATEFIQAIRLIDFVGRAMFFQQMAGITIDIPLQRICIKT